MFALVCLCVSELTATGKADSHLGIAVGLVYTLYTPGNKLANDIDLNDMPTDVYDT